MVNVPLLRKAVEWVEEQAQLPEIDREWNQSEWIYYPEDIAFFLITDTFPRSNSGLKGLEYVAARNALVEQLEPFCGTTYCVAGKIAADADPRYKTDNDVDGRSSMEFARQLLDLTRVQADRLFASCNDAVDVRRIAEEIAGEKL